MRDFLSAHDYEKVALALHELLGDDVARAIIELDRARFSDEVTSTSLTRKEVFDAAWRCAAVGLPGFSMDNPHRSSQQIADYEARKPKLSRDYFFVLDADDELDPEEQS